MITGRRSKLLPLTIGIAAAIALIALGGETASNGGSAAGLPSGSESARAAKLQADLPSSGQQPAIVIYSRADGRLTDQDRERIEDDRERLAKIAVGGEVAEPRFAPDDDAAILTVPLPEGEGNSDGGASDELGQAVEQIRTQVEADLPDQLRADVTGPAAFRADLSNVFDGADTRLLLVTALVVAVLLLLTYRSPWLWLVPLTVIGLADRTVASLMAILSREAGLIADGSTTGIVSVLVFGAGTNYALLLVARYREELRAHEDRHDAMRVAIGRAAPAILASSSTVALSLVMLAFADLPFSRNIGLAGAMGIVVALVFALTVLPPALLLFGRKLFWPVVPRYGTDNPALDGRWARIGAAVTKRPGLVSAATLALLVVLALGCLRIEIGLSQTEQLRDRPESVVGQERITETFGPGFGEPVTIVARTSAVDDVLGATQRTGGVLQARPGPADDEWAQISAQLEAPSGSDAALRTVEDLRERLDDAPGDAVVGGLDAESLDKQTAASHDERLIVPLVLIVIFVILVMLLRSIVAAVLLSLTNVISWAAALGAATLSYEYVFGFPAIDVPVPLLSFLFLIALGVDYNIFLITRAREEAAEQATRPAVVTALASTGGVITSAGIVLAAVFAVLGVLPLITLTQVGIVVGLGILLDTLVVRTILVPALVTLIGPRVWWPGSPWPGGRDDAPDETAGASGRGPTAASG
ncbi:MAG: MMPL family transporter [Patulibacter sp.]|nr:MMPL family transporter [Patulibacter sp.]